METPAPSVGEPLALRVQRIPAGNEAARGLISFELPRHGRHVILGPAGAGKTALLRNIGLALPPTRGGVALFGDDLARIAPAARYLWRRRLGVVFQHPWLMDDLSVHDNVMLAARAAGTESGLAQPRVAELLAWVGLARRSDVPAGDLDDEGRRRLAVARAVINGPALIIADEPTAGGGAAVPRLLRDLHAAGAALLIATRDEAFAESLACAITPLTGGLKTAIETA